MTNKILKKMKDRAKPNVQGSDFKKKKSKLGNKQTSAAATKTAFQSKVLHMPSQSLIEEKGEVVTSRNLTLKDLLIQLGHYSETVRKDAVFGIKELVTKYPYLLPLHLGAIIEKLLNLITDGDLSVRQALVGLFEVIIPQLELETLSAYFSVIRVYLLAGLTPPVYMYNTVRMTSLSIVELWIDHFPSLLIPIADQLLPTFIVVLNSVAAPAGVPSASTLKNAASQQSKPTTSAVSSKLSVLGNLRKLLRVLASHYRPSGSQETSQFIGGGDVTFRRGNNNNDSNNEEDYDEEEDDDVPTLVWGSSSVASMVMDQDHPVFLERQAAFFPQTLTTTSSSSSSTSSSSTPSSSSTESSSSSSSSTQDSNSGETSSSSSHEFQIVSDSWQFLHSFFQKLFPLLMANWVEIITSPHAVSLYPSSSSSSSTSAAAASTQLTNAHKSDIPYLEVMEVLLQILNLILELLGESGKGGKQKDIEKYLVSYFPLLGASDIALEINVHMCNTFAYFLESKVQNEQQKALINSMVNFIIQHFENPSMVKAQSHRLVGLLPVVRKLLTCVNNSVAQQLLQAFTVFDENSHPHSAAKRACVEFLSEILQAHQSRTAVYKPSDKIAKTGLLSLPKLLFKLSTQNLPTSQAILKALVLFGKGKSPIYESVQLPMVPFFFSFLKPSTKYPKGAKVYGPFVNLPVAQQQNALDLLYYFPSLAPNMVRALLACCAHDAVRADIACRAVDLVHHHFARAQTLDLDNYVAFLAGLQVGLSSKCKEVEERKKKRVMEGKRKREDADGDEVMEVEKGGEPIKSDNDSNVNTSVVNGNDDEVEEVRDPKKKNIIPEKVSEVSQKLSSCFGMLGGSEGADTIIGLIHSIFESALGEQPTLATRYCILQTIPAIYNAEKGNTWSDKNKQSKLPETLQKILPATIEGYLLAIASEGQLDNKSLTSGVFSIFLLWADILVETLKLFTVKINEVEKTHLFQVVQTLVVLLSESHLEKLLLQDKIKKELLNIVAILKEDKFSSENKNTTILGKLQSDVTILYGLN